MLLDEAFEFAIVITISYVVTTIIFYGLKFNSKEETKKTKVSRLRNTSHRRGIR
ncbi:hypothetical protein PDN08_28535 [Bacillus cereus]|nr:hypothetical protein [Bacillus cereus]MDA2208558.1 hypothetical protein [Bacillus cereus]MDA2755340.1 hypothetical protein [Bacillus cereus]